MGGFSVRGRHDGVGSIVALALASVSGIALSAPASAQPVSSESGQRNYDVPAQSLLSALVQFAQQAQLQVLFDEHDLAGLTSRPVHGHLTSQTALAQLLPTDAPRIQIVGDQILNVENARPQDGGAEPSASEEIVVTGTRLHGAPPAGANLIGLDRGAIDQTGRTTLQDVLRTLPQVFPGSQNELTQLNSTSPGGNFALGSSVDLRGLGSDATVTLVNGRRLAPAGLGNFVDISAIPVAAIERIEVLADGASATYGADAVGGVVNVIMRRELDHPETTIRYGGADGTSEAGFSHVQGWNWTGGSLLAGYEYRHQEELKAADRDYAASTDLRRFGGSDFSRRAASPGNIISVGGTPVTLAIPAGQDGLALSAADLIAGQTNLQNGNQDTDLLPEQSSHSLFVSAHQDLNDSVSLFLDVLASERTAHAEKTQLGGVVSVPETNFYRQQNGLFAGQGPLLINYFFGNDFGPSISEPQARSLASAAGADFELGSDWQGEASISYGNHVDNIRNRNFADFAAIAGALASSDAATAFNPFGDGGDNSVAALLPLTFSQHIANHAELVTYAVSADGPLFQLPGGAARLGVGAERRRETFRITQRETHSGVEAARFVQTPAARTTDAFYAEAYLPIIAHAALSLSVRREDSSDFGVATTPKIGAQWSPFADLTLRGTWGKSFKAPAFHDLLGGSAAILDDFPDTLDPNATNGSTGLLDLVGSNPDLKPERAETWTAGFDYQPHWLSGLKLSATYFDIDFSNRIATPGFILDAFQHPENFPGSFIRNPTPEQIAAALALIPNVVGNPPVDGIEVIFDERLTNLAALRVRGVDLSASYAMPTDFGQLSFFANASGLLQFSRQNSPASPSAALLNTMLNPIDWRAHAGVALDADTWSASLSLEYDNGYEDNLSLPNRQINSWIGADARIAKRFNIRGDAATEVALEIRNLADADPPFANNPSGMGLDTLNASPLGRLVMLEVRQQW